MTDHLLSTPLQTIGPAHALGKKIRSSGERPKIAIVFVIERIADNLCVRRLYVHREAAEKIVAEKYGAGWHVVEFAREGNR